MAELAGAYLPLEPSEPAPGARGRAGWRRALAAAALGCGLLLLAVAAAGRGRSDHPLVLAPLGEPPAAADAPALELDAGAPAREAPAAECLADTGGTCSLHACASWRNATCSRGFIGKCTCEDSCVGADFACHEGKNELVAQGFRLENVWFRGYYPYANIWTHLHDHGDMVVSSQKEDTGIFSLWRLPGSAEGMKKYIIAPSKYPNDLVQLGRVMTFGSGYALATWDWVSSPADPSAFFWCVCKVNGHMRFGVREGDDYLWAYITHASWTMYASSWGTPDERDEWIVPPSLLALLDDCP